MGRFQPKVSVRSVQCLQRPEEGLPQITLAWSYSYELGLSTMGEQLLLTAPDFIFNHVCMCVQVWPSTHISNAYGSQKRVSISLELESEALILVLPNSATYRPQMVLTKWLH